jgi:hypothetical protein
MGWQDAPVVEAAPKWQQAPEVDSGRNPVFELGANLATGATGSIAGGLAGLGQAATNALGLTTTPAGDRVRAVQSALTYEPRSEAGKGAAALVSWPFEKLADAAEAAGGAQADKGRPLLGAGLNTAIQALPMALGPAARAIPGESAAAVAARAKAQALNAPAEQGVAAAREAGLTITPTQAGAGPVSRAVESVAGAPRLEKLASRKNAPIINDMIRRDVGLPDDVPLSPEALANVRAEAGKAYEAVKGVVGRFGTDAQYKSDLYSITKSFETAAKDFAHRSENPFKKTMDGLNVDSMDAAAAVEEVKLLRADADKAFANRDKQLGNAYKDAAKALDDQLNRHLQRHASAISDPAFADAVERYRAARVQIAKAYAAEDAITDKGNVDARVYAKALKKGAPLTGEAKQVGEFAQQFSKSLQPVEPLGPTGPTLFDLLLGGSAGVVGTALGGVPATPALAMAGLRPGLRSLMATGPVQDALAKPRVYGRPGYRTLQELIAEAATPAATVGVPTGNR